jgi:hypothetical protein
MQQDAVCLRLAGRVLCDSGEHWLSEALVDYLLNR